MEPRYNTFQGAKEKSVISRKAVNCVRMKPALRCSLNAFLSFAPHPLKVPITVVIKKNFDDCYRKPLKTYQNVPFMLYYNSDEPPSGFTGSQKHLSAVKIAVGNNIFSYFTQFLCKKNLKNYYIKCCP